MHGINYTATECTGLILEGKRNHRINIVNVPKVNKDHKTHNIPTHLSRVFVGNFEQVFPWRVVWSPRVYKC